MTSEIIKRMFDACYQAKRTREMLPPLPEGVRSSFIQYLDTIQSLEGQGVQVKVSDISDAMELPSAEDSTEAQPDTSISPVTWISVLRSGQ